MQHLPLKNGGMSRRRTVGDSDYYIAYGAGRTLLSPAQAAEVFTATA
jgi:hypothetical protein